MMTDVIALDVSMGKSNCVWYRQKKCLKQFNLFHTKSGFSQLAELVHQAQKPTIFFEATGIYSRSVERFCIDHNYPYCRLNPLELRLKSENLRRVKTDLRDARRIAYTAQENHFRLTTPRSTEYLQLHELNRFYNQLNADVSTNSIQP